MCQSFHSVYSSLLIFSLTESHTSNKAFNSHFTSSQADLLYSSVLLVSVRFSSLRLTWMSLHSLRNCPRTAWVTPDVLKITPRHGPERKHIFPILLWRSVYWTIGQQRSSRWLHRKPVTWSLPLLRNLATGCLPPMPSYTRYSILVTGCSFIFHCEVEGTYWKNIFL
jgi:hypothetical protein